GGLGISKWLLRHGARLTITDLKDRRALAPSIEALERLRKTLGRKARPIRYALGGHRREDFIRADMIVQNPGVPRTSAFLKLARARGGPVESDLSIFFRLCRHPIVGVSGTKGKTTVTAMIGAMLEEAFGRVVIGGNIRTSPLDRLDALIRSKRPVPVL